jgi:hypothetical protein
MRGFECGCSGSCPAFHIGHKCYRNCSRQVPSQTLHKAPLVSIEMPAKFAVSQTVRPARLKALNVRTMVRAPHLISTSVCSYNLPHHCMLVFPEIPHDLAATILSHDAPPPILCRLGSWCNFSCIVQRWGSPSCGSLPRI